MLPFCRILVDARRVLPNVTFEVDDIEALWAHAAPFDFIFSRYMAASISDWPGYVRNIYANMTPGGWVEFQDYEPMYHSNDGSLKEEHYTYKWISNLLEASQMNDRDPSPGRSIEGWVREAGFQNVHHRQAKVPIGPWPKNELMVWIISLSSPGES